MEKCSCSNGCGLCNSRHKARIEELTEIHETAFHTIPHTKVFGELLTIAREQDAEITRMRQEIVHFKAERHNVLVALGVRNG